MFDKYHYQDGITDLGSVSCVPYHSCNISEVAHDDNVTVKSYQDHLGFPLSATDEVNLGGEIVASCDMKGTFIRHNIHYFHNLIIQMLH